MAKATTTSTAQRYVIRYTIRDGDHEYRQDLTELFSAEPTEELVVHALVDNLRCEDGDLAQQQKDAWKQYQHDQYLEIPGDYRLVDDITWEAELGTTCRGCRMMPCGCIPVGDEQEAPSAHAPLLYGSQSRAVGDRQVTDLIEALVRLLECPDLNVDELDIISIEAIENAQGVLAKAKGQA